MDGWRSQPLASDGLESPCPLLSGARIGTVARARSGPLAQGVSMTDSLFDGTTLRRNQEDEQTQSKGTAAFAGPCGVRALGHGRVMGTPKQPTTQHRERNGDGQQSDSD